MTISEKINAIHSELVAKVSAIADRPEGWLPHLVFVEEECEDRNGRGTPVYAEYRLVDFTADGACILRNEATNKDEERHLSEINIDWLLTVWNWYNELTSKPEPTESGKELCVFLFPQERFERSATNEEIIAYWESNEDFDIQTEKLTPDEFACRCNDEAFADQIYWVRFIKM